MLKAGDLVLRRAARTDLDAVLTLQRAAYARNREMLGVEPMPLMADYEAIFRDYEVWVTADGPIAGVLILEPRADDLLIWSIATDPQRQQSRLGHKMLTAADERARELGVGTVRLYTGTVLRHLVDWYTRNGFVTERIEPLSDRSVTHMVKYLDARPSTVD
jgi:N-acetylglutamate synthase-like GNAT family acetyltransferase